MIQSKSADHAKAYFDDALVKADYYLQDQEIKGQLHGKLAERLDIAGPISRTTFYALCENKNPITGDRLTPRTKQERTTGYDINFHAPKSVSVVHVLSGDDHILNAFRDSVNETMREIEADSKARVRKNGKDEDRPTGELVWTDFIHQTARPVEGHTPDPHLHAHCYTFNITYDPIEKRLKAGQFRDINRDMPYYQAMFHKRLSDKLIDLGYQVKATNKSFEIEGVPQNVIDLFSKRTDAIGRVAKEKGITSAAKLAELGAKTRAGKQKGHTMDDLRSSWKDQIRELGNGPEAESQPLRFAKDRVVKTTSAGKCVDHALQHTFERASVMSYRRLLESAYRYSIGRKGVTVSEIGDKMSSDKRIINVHEKGRAVCTTKEVLQEERRMVNLARNGVGKMAPLYNYAPGLNLKGQLADAATEVLTTSNRVSIIRGAAGAGKTTLMTELVPMIEKKGEQVSIFAPTAKASRGVLRNEGFKNAETVATLLTNKELQGKLKNGTLIVDEAGLLGTKDMADILDVATQQNARVILVGDTRQHASVVRGDALRILNTVGGIKTAEVNKIYRQKNVAYRGAVADLSKGDIKQGFEKLDEIGFIEQVDPLKPNQKLVEEYVSALRKGKSALVVSPTHKQGEEVTEAIRAKLRECKMIGKKEVEIDKLTNTNMTVAEKNDWRNLKEGQVVQFNQNFTGIKRGSVWTIYKSRETEVLIMDKAGNVKPLPEKKGDKFDIYETSRIGLSKGDLVQVTRNGFDKQAKRLDNGQEFKVLKVTKKGNILLQNTASKFNYSVDKDFGHISHAHCITSHAAQGKTVDEVYISQPASTFGATDAKQFYVSVSRAREKAKIYTDDKAELLEHASQAGDRQSAMELTNKRDHHSRTVERLQRGGREDRHHDKADTRDSYEAPDHDKEKMSLSREDHEPGV
jgi:conjugative relaxase-like TrwC/TraI family protein